jgi:hypothetical protein
MLATLPLGLLGLGLAQAPPASTGTGQPVVLNDDGGYCWFQDERALVVDDTLLVGSVASGHLDPERRGDVELTTYSLSTGQVRRTTLHDGLGLDDHNAPALLERSDGRLLLAYAAHGSESRFYFRVSEPGAPGAAWGPVGSCSPSEASRITYTNLLKLSAEERVYDFYRGLDDSFKPSYAWSHDAGETWRSGGIVIDVPGQTWHRPYVKYVSDGNDTIHLAFTEGHPRDFDNSVFHVVYRAGLLRRSDGTPIRPLAEGLRSPDEGTRLFQGDADNVAWVQDLAQDAEGRPIVAFSAQRGGAGVPAGQGGEDHRYHLARWDGSRWIENEIAFAGTRLYAGEDDYVGGMALVPGDANQVVISTDVDPTTGARLPGGNHEMFQGTATAAGWRFTPLTTASAHDNIRPIVPAGAGSRLLLWLRGTYRSYTDYDMQILLQRRPSS